MIHFEGKHGFKIYAKVETTTPMRAGGTSGYEFGCYRCACCGRNNALKSWSDSSQSRVNVKSLYNGSGEYCVTRGSRPGPGPKAWAPGVGLWAHGPGLGPRAQGGRGPKPGPGTPRALGPNRRPRGPGPGLGPGPCPGPKPWTPGPGTHNPGQPLQPLAILNNPNGAPNRRPSSAFWLVDHFERSSRTRHTHCKPLRQNSPWFHPVVRRTPPCCPAF